MYLPAPDESIWVGVIRLVLSVPGSRGLKDKRRVVHQVRDRLRARRNVSVAEVGHLDSHSHAVIAVSMVGNDARYVRGALDGILDEIAGWRVGLIESASVELSRPYDDPTGHADDDDAGYEGFEDLDG